MTELNTHVLAIDPGGTTGWVRVLLRGSLPDSTGKRRWATAVPIRWGLLYNLGDEEHCAGLMYKGADYVVCEDYMIYPDPQIMLANVGSKLTAVRVMGRVEWLCRQYNLPFPIYQTASKAKQWWPDNRLRLHFPQPTYNLRPSGRPGVKRSALCRHECDALRHAMTFIEDHFNLKLVVRNAGTIV